MNANFGRDDNPAPQLPKPAPIVPQPTPDLRGGGGAGGLSLIVILVWLACFVAGIIYGRL